MLGRDWGDQANNQMGLHVVGWGWTLATGIPRACDKSLRGLKNSPEPERQGRRPAGTCETWQSSDSPSSMVSRDKWRIDWDNVSQRLREVDIVFLLSGSFLKCPLQNLPGSRFLPPRLWIQPWAARQRFWTQLEEGSWCMWDWVKQRREATETQPGFFSLPLLRDLAPVKFELFCCLFWFLLSAFPGKSTKDFVDLEENS